MNYRKVKAVITATVEVQVEVEVDTLIAEWPIPVSWDAHVRLMEAARHKLKHDPPELTIPSIDKAELKIKSSNMSKWTW
jgi:hypothetical protein